MNTAYDGVQIITNFSKFPLKFRAISENGYLIVNGNVETHKIRINLDHNSDDFIGIHFNRSNDLIKTLKQVSKFFTECNVAKENNQVEVFMKSFSKIK